MYLALPISCHRPGKRAPALRFSPRFAVLIAGLAGLLPIRSQAAGGHHAVDDASTVDPGQCQVEVWMEHAPGRQLQHLGPACQTWGVEIGLNLERSVTSAESTLISKGLQLKWARELEPGFSLGAVWAAGWQSGSPRFAGNSLLVPLSWTPRDELALHLNVGRDFPAQAPSVSHYGVAFDWQPDAHWQGLIEGWHDGLGSQGRLGLRYFLNERLSVDISRARFLKAPGGSWWTLGLNWAIDR